MSLQRAPGDGLHSFEEGARWLRLFGQGDVDLEMGLCTPHSEPLDVDAGAMRLGQQSTGTGRCSGLGAVHADVTRIFNRVRRPSQWQPPARLAAGPTDWIERFELEFGQTTQYTADDQDITAAADAANRPHPGHVTRLEKDDQGDRVERGVAGAEGQFDCSRTQPAHGGPLAEHGQTVLHPVHQQAAATNIPGGASGEPRHDHDRGDSDDFSHGGTNDSIPFTAKWSRILREVLYGMTTYEFVQQASELRAQMHRLFLAGVFGDMIGVPILPSYYGLRLLPWIVPEIEKWKREVLRERELGTDHEHHLHGL
jgi:hypothetical protein